MTEAYKSLYCAKENSIIREQTTQAVNNSAPKSANTTTHEEIFSLIFQKDLEAPAFDVDIQTLINLKIKRVNDELCNYSLIISNPDFKKQQYSTKEFWTKKATDFPHLHELSKALFCIQSSSAFIERFFSICGVVCKKRSSNMSDEKIILRSFLKSNMKLLNEMNATFKE